MQHHGITAIISSGQSHVLCVVVSLIQYKLLFINYY